jgi:AcrR family transcriptional regulator
MGISGEQTSAGRRSGRPRDPAIDRAVLEATLAVLDEVGYGRLALEEVARRAGTTKPAIYRRWPTRQQLVLAALALRLGGPQAPDTSCTLCDIDECLKVFVSSFKQIRPAILGPLLADCVGDRDLRDAFMTTLFEPPRAAVKQTLDRAHARGDLRDDVDRDLVLDLIGSLVHYRALFRHAPMSDEEIERVVEALLQGIATDYPSLLEHSRSMSSDSHVHQLHRCKDPSLTGRAASRARAG